MQKHLPMKIAELQIQSVCMGSVIFVGECLWLGNCLGIQWTDVRVSDSSGNAVC